MAAIKLFGRKKGVGFDDVGLLILRAVAGGLLAGHGAQKLFGWFDGPGFIGTAKWLESEGMRPARLWAALGGLAELGGGLLTAFGFLGPVGPIGILASMSMATARFHAGKPIWAVSGGAELPVVNMAVATNLILSGHGLLSLDGALDLHVPRWVALPGIAAVGVGVSLGMKRYLPEVPVRREDAGAVLQAGAQAAHPL